MASLLLRSAGRVLRRSLQQGPLRRSPAQPFVDNPRRFSSDAVNKHSCAPENSLNSIEAGLDVNLQIMRATAEQAKVILQKITEDELADKKRETVVLGAFAFLGLTLCAGESLFGGVKKEKSQAVEPLI